MANNIHFIDGGDAVVSILTTLLDLAGPNYNLPYSSDNQPSDGTERNADDLLQYQLPGGTALSGYSEPSQGESMGTAINSLLITVAPFLSAYGLVLPIFGVIIGIIQVLCALMNPWSIRKAVKKLKKKWLPPLLSLFPALAGVIIVLSTLKAILSIVFQILSVVVPMIKLAIHDIQLLGDAISGDANREQKIAIREKLMGVLTELINQTGILAVIKPIIDIIMLIIKLAAKKPCKKKKKGPKIAAMSGAVPSALAASKGYDSAGEDLSENFDMTGMHHAYDESEDDSSCCDDEVCPPILLSPPSGRGYLLPTFFADSPPGFAWVIIPFGGVDDLMSLSPYMQGLKAQLDSQLDEPISEAKFAGQTSDPAHLIVKITGRRGTSQTLEIPLAKLSSGGRMYIIGSSLRPLIGTINYEIVVNWDMLIAHNIVSIGCDPEIEELNDALDQWVPDLDPVAVQYPETQSIGSDYDTMRNGVNNLINSLGNTLKSVVFSDPTLVDIKDELDDITQVKPGEFVVTPIDAEPFEDFALIPETDPADPPYDTQIADMEQIINDFADLLFGYADNIKGKMNSILSKATNSVNSELDVDKHLVRAGGQDLAIIYVTPKDTTGVPLLQNLPEGVSISVDIFSTFGDITNQVTDKKTGVVTAELRSLLPGDAVVTAKVNSEYIRDFDGETTPTTRELDVKFVSDGALPKRRLVSKPKTSSKKHITVSSYEREPGGK